MIDKEMISIDFEEKKMIYPNMDKVKKIDECKALADFIMSTKGINDYPFAYDIASDCYENGITIKNINLKGEELDKIINEKEKKNTSFDVTEIVAQKPGKYTLSADTSQILFQESNVSEEEKREKEAGKARLAQRMEKQDELKFTEVEKLASELKLQDNTDKEEALYDIFNIKDDESKEEETDQNNKSISI
jgi:hypothetical protein